VTRETMTARERFHATFEYSQPDRVFQLNIGVWDETYRQWLHEGMPWDQHFNTYFGFDRLEVIPLRTGLCASLWPPPETKVIQQTAEWQIVEDELGAKTKRWTDGHEGMPQYLRYPVRDRDSWEKLKERLNPDAPNRYPEYWEDLKRCYRNRDYPLRIQAGSFYGQIRDWVGMEHLALWYYDCPDLVHEMTEYVADFTLRVIDRALSEIPDIDCANIWEDMGMKTGPLISPKLFREFHMEPMKRVTKVLREAGIQLISIDSDGNLDELIPLWLEAGANMVWPLEVAAGCDPVRYRKQFGKKLRLMGGIDKRVLREDMPKEAIEEEVMSKVGLIKEGGYSPIVDHMVPPDVPLENFQYYMKLIHQVCTF